MVLASTRDMVHEGAEKTLHRLLTDFYVPSVCTTVCDHVWACTTCQKNKTGQVHPIGLLQPLTVLSVVWCNIAMDFVKGLPCVNGKTVILTVVNRLSKYTHNIALSHPYTAASVAWAFFDSIVRLHGIPESIVSDHDPVFTSQFWTELFSLFGV
jgi:hypothetical protein